MSREEQEISDAVRSIEQELRTLRNHQLDIHERRRAARMIQNLALVALGTLEREPASNGRVLT